MKPLIDKCSAAAEMGYRLATIYMGQNCGVLCPPPPQKKWGCAPVGEGAGSPYVFPVNLAHIRSAFPEIFHTQTKMSQIAPKAELYAVHCVQ